MDDLNNNKCVQNYTNLHNSILEQINPTKTKRTVLINAILNLFKHTEEIIKQQDYKYTLEPILVGSTAKETYLMNPDIDLFIMFPVSVPVDELRRVGLEIGKKILPQGQERYAEHPYISGTFEDFETDIVPCYKLASINDRMTAVDRTPFHTRYIVENLTVEQRSEVRLLKQLMKGVGVYGAEIQVQGFSGYLCELLILKYGSLLNLLRTASDWPDELVLRLDEVLSNHDDIEFIKHSELPPKLAIKFKDEPFVFIDPVDPTRNVASAVSNEKFNFFKITAKEYLKDPKREFFFPNKITPLTLDELSSRVQDDPKILIGLEFGKPEVIPDVLYGQVRKCQRAIWKLLDAEGFGVLDADFFVNSKILLLFELKIIKLPDIQTHTGPPEGHKNVQDFLNKWETSDQAVNRPYLMNHRWFVEIKRDFTSPDKLLNAKLPKLNIGKQLNDEIKKGFGIYSNDKLLIPGYELPLTSLIEKKYPWKY
jgi:tRNA nucleotidyltransferase (CCA-adding enzyme)